jgi:hypothetical protein
MKHVDNACRDPLGLSKTFHPANFVQSPPANPPPHGPVQASRPEANPRLGVSTPLNPTGPENVGVVIAKAFLSGLAWTSAPAPGGLWYQNRLRSPNQRSPRLKPTPTTGNPEGPGWRSPHSNLFILRRGPAVCCHHVFRVRMKTGAAMRTLSSCY